ncbi:MAG: Asp-tRNA(Asn)/Glu-tRNA(Gln) amidotransferase GatCAB subunit B, partial [Oscillospiraceae bacterium]|nr:Asp-tRNA(Asn)/Glu-tRNA(Gln) amidotransferase GatCAB subunit B [Oscillospiraceae bacterium]
RRVLAALWEKDVDPKAFVAENNLAAQSDEGAIKDVVTKVVSSNEKIVADYKAGKTKAIQALFGLVMKELRGNGDPAVIRSLLEDALK